MSAKADKGDRKREIEQSPMKKKFRDSAISSEDLDNAIANRIELAFKEHQSTLNSVVNSAVRDAMDSVLIPALRELREDIQATNKSVKGDLTHTVSPNLMLILSTYRVVLHPSYLQKVFSFIIFIKGRYRFTILSEKSRAPGGVPCGRS